MPIPQQLENIAFMVIAPSKIGTTVKGVLTSLFRTVSFDQGRKIIVESDSGKDGIYTSVKLENSIYSWEYLDCEIMDPLYNEQDRANRVKERVRLGVKSVICQEYDIPLGPWGILIGVRPTKLIHRYLDRNFTLEQIRHILTDVYVVSPARQEMLINITLHQRPYFHANANNPVGIYVGIPFCPTRCGYCSFAAYPLATHKHLVPGFLVALEQEIVALGTLLQRLDIQVETVYLGGGTPTTIQGRDLERLLTLINKNFNAAQCAEYTVEAGRPETLTSETIQIMKQCGVQRISINPQTMRDETLKRIGRQHTADQVRAAFARVRKAGFKYINSDIILGLPGEDLADLEYTLSELAKLAPENITVHSLALKRAANWRSNVSDLDLQQDLGTQMAALTKQYMEKLGQIPYYMYRQRYILSDLENVGYALPGAESLYNIQMMEERQTVIGAGGGAITKLVDQDLGVVRQANPKCPGTYQQQISTIIATKKSQIRQHLLV